MGTTKLSEMIQLQILMVGLTTQHSLTSETGSVLPGVSQKAFVTCAQE